ncbi:MAG: hypothetical protein J7L22_08030 [Candidatus Marinimicrobia bacterium]|nr:hypothetical protein [Candidatus Neomarinimicrobiota bacterium]
MSTTKIAVIAGDGIGPDLFNQTRKIIDILNRKFDNSIDYHIFPYSADYYLKTGISIPDEFIDDVSRIFDGILLGPLGDPRIPEMKHAKEIIYKLRSRLNLRISIHPVKLFQNWLSILKDIENKSVNYHIIKEIYESTVSHSEQIFNKDKESAIVLQSNLLTMKNIRIFIQQAFSYFQKAGLKNGCFVYPNPKFQQKLYYWNQAISEIKEKYPEIEITYKYPGTAIQDIMLNPGEFDFFLTGADIGDILMVISSVTMGGCGLSYSIESNPDLISVYRIMQASATKLVGSNTINPFGAFLTLYQILKDNDHRRESELLMDALMTNFSNHWVTIDLGGIMGTEEVTDYICDYIRRN